MVSSPPSPPTTVQARAARSAVALAGGGLLVAAALVAVGLLLAAHRPGWDDDAAAWAAGRGGRWLEIVTLVLSEAGTVPGVLAALAVALTVARSRRRWRDLSLLGVAATVELAVFLVVSTVVDRPRPPVRSPDAAALTGAFPSGHAAMAVVLLLGLALLVPRSCPAGRRAAVAGAAIGASLIAAARVLRGQHRPSEIVAGLALGAVTVALVAGVARRHGWFPDAPEPPAGVDRCGSRRIRAHDDGLPER